MSPDCWSDAPVSPPSQERPTSPHLQTTAEPQKRCLVFQESSDVLERVAVRAARAASKPLPGYATSSGDDVRRRLPLGLPSSSREKSDQAVHPSDLGLRSGRSSPGSPSHNALPLPSTSVDSAEGACAPSSSCARKLKFAASPGEVTERRARHSSSTQARLSRKCIYEGNAGLSSDEDVYVDSVACLTRSFPRSPRLRPRRARRRSPAPTKLTYRERVSGIRGGGPAGSPAPTGRIHGNSGSNSDSIGDESESANDDGLQKSEDEHEYDEDDEGDDDDEEDEEEENEEDSNSDSEPDSGSSGSYDDEAQGPVKSLPELITSLGDLKSTEPSADSRSSTHPACFLPDAFEDSTPSSPRSPDDFLGFATDAEAMSNGYHPARGRLSSTMVSDGEITCRRPARSTLVHNTPRSPLNHPHTTGFRISSPRPSVGSRRTFSNPGSPRCQPSLAAASLQTVTAASAKSPPVSVASQMLREVAQHCFSPPRSPAHDTPSADVDGRGPGETMDGREGDETLMRRERSGSMPLHSKGGNSADATASTTLGTDEPSSKRRPAPIRIVTPPLILRDSDLMAGGRKPKRRPCTGEAPPPNGQRSVPNVERHRRKRRSGSMEFAWGRCRLESEA